MWDLGRVTLIGTLAGVLGTGIGGLLIAFIGRPKDNLLSFLLAFSSGIMIAVVFHDLIPESLLLGNVYLTFSGILLGVFSLILTNYYLPDSYTPNHRKISTRHHSNSRLMRTGLLLGLGIAIHNFPEGLAIGAGYMASEELGFGLAFALALHNIPEGMAMAAPTIAGGLNRFKVVLLAALAGLPMGLGTLIGGIFGSLSPLVLSIALGFAAGAMIFLVFHELLPQSQKMNYPRAATLGAIIGILLGLFALLTL